MMRPTFDLGNISRELDSFVNEQDRQLFLTLIYVGESFVNMARRIGSYRDRTGNLRGSIGYAIVKGGQILKFSVTAEIKKEEVLRDGVKSLRRTKSGAESAKIEIERLAKMNSSRKGYVLIGIAGMSYAAAVESKGFDVISGSVPSAEKLLQELKEGLGL